MSYPDKEKRVLCWNSRDSYWKCLEEHAPQYQTTSGDPEPKQCQKFRKLFEKDCPAQWVKHFDRKRTYEQFKERVNKGEDPIESRLK